MDKEEAAQVLREYLAGYERRTYAELAALVDGEPDVATVTGPSGTTYHLEVQVFWDDRKRIVLRVMGCIDDGGLRAFAPLSESLLVSPPTDA